MGLCHLSGIAPGNDGYHGKYCGCRTPDHGCGKAQGHGNPKCRQDQSSATGTSYCACNPGWSKEDCSCSDRSRFLEDSSTNFILSSCLARTSAGTPGPDCAVGGGSVSVTGAGAGRATAAGTARRHGGRTRTRTPAPGSHPASSRRSTRATRCR